MRPTLARDRTFILRLTPLIAGILGAVAACIGASLQSLPLPLDVAGVFLALGLAATWIARATPLRGALFLLILATIVTVVAYAS